MGAAGELELAASCRRRISEGEAAAAQRILPLASSSSLRRNIRNCYTPPACSFLDCDSSVTRTAEMLFLHKNTIKYRLQRISDLLGYRIGKMPETIELYRRAAIYRLLHEAH